MPLPAIAAAVGNAAKSAAGSALSKGAGLGMDALGGAFDKLMAGMKSAVETLKNPITSFKALIGTVGEQVGSLVAKANPASFRLFQIAVDDLNGSIGRILVPVMNMWTGLVRKVADAISSLGPAGQKLLRMTFGMELLGKVLGKVLDKVLPPLVRLFESLGERADATVSALMPLVDVMARFFGRIVTWVANLAEKTTPIFRLFAKLVEVWTTGQSAVSEVQEEFDKLMMELEPLADIVSDLAAVIAESLINALAEAIKLVTQLARALTDMIKTVAKAIREFMNQFGLGRREKKNPIQDGASEGASVRQTSISDIGSYISKAYTAAFASGTPEKKIEDNTRRSAEAAERIEKLMNLFTSDGAGSFAKAAMRAVVPGF